MCQLLIEMPMYQELGGWSDKKNVGGWPKQTGGTLAPKIYMEGGILS